MRLMILVMQSYCTFAYPAALTAVRAAVIVAVVAKIVSSPMTVSVVGRSPNREQGGGLNSRAESDAP